MLAQHVITTSEQLQQQLKLAKRRLPADVNITNLGMAKDIHEELNQSYQHAGKILKTMYEIAKAAAQFLATSGGQLIRFLEFVRNFIVDFYRKRQGTA